MSMEKELADALRNLVNIAGDYTPSNARYGLVIHAVQTGSPQEQVDFTAVDFQRAKEVLHRYDATR